MKTKKVDYIKVRGIVDRDLNGHNYYSSTNEWGEKLKSISDDSARESFDDKKDSLRFYMLGKKGQQKIEHHGAKESFDIFKDPLIL